MIKIILFLAFSFCAHAQNAHIPFARTLLEGAVEYDYYTDYFKTTATVNSAGEKTTLPSDLSYQKLDFGVNGRYGFTSELEGMIGVNGRYIQSNVEFNNEVLGYTKSGLESVIVGIKYGFKEEDSTRYAIEGWYKQAMHSNSFYKGSEEPSTISLGDDGKEMAIGLSFYTRTKSLNFIEGRVLYRNPGADLSSELLSLVQFSTVWKYFALNLGVENVYSLKGDAYTGEEDQKPVIYAGTTSTVNSINRQWTAPYIGMNLALGREWRIETQFAQVYTGVSTDLGPRISVHLVKRKEESKNFAKLDSQFKEYTIEGSVTKLSKSKKVAVADIGLESGLEVGMSVDFYFFDYVGGNELIAKGSVLKVKATQSIIAIQKKYGRRRVDVGTVVRANEVSSQSN